MPNLITYIANILIIERKGRLLLGEGLLSHDYLSSEPVTLVPSLQSKSSALHCDLLSGPAAVGSGENKVLSPGKWGSLWSERLFLSSPRFRCSRYCKKSQWGLNDSIFMSELMNSCRDCVYRGYLILYIYQFGIYEWTRMTKAASWDADHLFCIMDTEETCFFCRLL